MTDYTQVLSDLDSHIASLEAELSGLKAARPAVLLLLEKHRPAPTKGPYADMKPTRAIPIALKGVGYGLTSAEIAALLVNGGMKSNARNFPSSVSATLSQLMHKNIVRKVGDNWILDNHHQQ